MKWTSCAVGLSGFVALYSLCSVQLVAQTASVKGVSSKVELDPTELKEQATGVLSTYCVACHGPNKQEGEVQLNSPESLDAVDRQSLFRQVQDVVHLTEMPPEEARQPSDAERKILLQWVNSELTGKAGLSHAGGADQGHQTDVWIEEGAKCAQFIVSADKAIGRGAEVGNARLVLDRGGNHLKSGFALIPVALAVYGAEVFRAGRAGLDFLAQASDCDVDRAAQPGIVLPPHLLKQIIPGKHFARVRHKPSQQPVFSRGEGAFSPFAEDNAMFQIDGTGGQVKKLGVVWKIHATSIERGRYLRTPCAGS